MKLVDIIEGMQIIAKYATTERDAFCVQAEHDQIYCGSYDLPLTKEEKERDPTIYIRTSYEKSK